MAGYRTRSGDVKSRPKIRSVCELGHRRGDAAWAARVVVTKRRTVPDLANSIRVPRFQLASFLTSRPNVMAASSAFVLFLNRLFTETARSSSKSRPFNSYIFNLFFKLGIDFSINRSSSSNFIHYILLLFHFSLCKTKKQVQLHLQFTPTLFDLFSQWNVFLKWKRSNFICTWIKLQLNFVRFFGTINLSSNKTCWTSCVPTWNFICTSFVLHLNSTETSHQNIINTFN